jgi:hypothetical protein
MLIDNASVGLYTNHGAVPMGSRSCGDAPVNTGMNPHGTLPAIYCVGIKYKVGQNIK